MDHEHQTQETVQVVAQRCGCRSWFCDRCAVRMGIVVRTAIELHMAATGWIPFAVTLSVNPAWFGSPAEAYEFCRRFFGKFVEELRRRDGKGRCSVGGGGVRLHSGSYVCFFEPHKSGWPHWHLLLDAKFVDITNMASEASHIELANLNQDALQHMIVRADDFPQWVATIAFYKAVHIVEAILAKTNFHSTTHSVRRSKVLHAPFNSDAYKHYRVLWGASTVARYLQDNDTGAKYKSFSMYMPGDKVVEKLVNRRLKSFENCTISLLSTGAAGSLKRVS